MKVTSLLENLKFGDKEAHAEPVHSDRKGRAILFTLKAGQSIRAHNAPSSPFFAVELKGRGAFAGGNGVDHTCGPNSLLVFDEGENHTIRALEELVFAGILHGAPGAQK